MISYCRNAVMPAKGAMMTKMFETKFPLNTPIDALSLMPCASKPRPSIAASMASRILARVVTDEEK